MRRAGRGLMAVLVLAAMSGTALGAQHLYRWVKDRTVTSDRTLASQQKIRVIPITEAQALELVRKVMAEDLVLALDAYHPTKHIQDAETTSDTVLPEEVVGPQEMDLELVDQDYRYFLEVKLRTYGDRTRITVKASPMYRIRDLEAENEAYGDSGTTGTSVDIKVSAGTGAAVAVGPIFIAPFDGLPLDYRIQPLPEAATRTAQIVRSFLYDLDKRVAASRPQ